MDDYQKALLVEQGVITLVNSLLPLITQAYAAVNEGDSAKLDALQAQLEAQSNALKPPGGVDAVVVAKG